MRKLFKDEKLQQEFDEKGYVKVPLIDKATVTALTEFYLINNKRHSNYDSTFAEFSVLNAELEQRKMFFDKISEVLLPKANEIIDRGRPIIANFVCKEPGVGFVPVHQNWAVVDETKYTSVSVWCPLIDVNATNGTLAFVDGSHKYFRGPRGSYADRPFKDVEEIIVKDYLNFVDVTAGEAIILDDSVIHYSDNNKSDKMRLAIQLILIPEEAPAYHYTFPASSEKNSCDLYEVDPNYYLGMVNWVGDLSNYKKLQSFNYDNKVYSPKEFVSIMSGKEQQKGFAGLLKRLVGLN